MGNAEIDSFERYYLRWYERRKAGDKELVSSSEREKKVEGEESREKAILLHCSIAGAVVCSEQ